MAAQLADIATLVQRLRWPATRVQAAGALASLCQSGPAPRGAVAAAGGVPALVECLRSGDEAAQPPAACALLNLVLHSPALADAIVISDALPVLIACLSSHSREAQWPACHVLDALASSPERCAACAAAGAVRPLVRLLDSSDALVCAAAANALCQLSGGGLAVLAEIARAAAVPTLLRLLQHSSDERVLVGALGTLANLAMLGEVQRAAAAGTIPAVPVLLRFLERAYDEGMQEAAAVALNNLALSAEAGRAIVAAGGVPALVAQLRAHGRSCMGAAGALGHVAQLGADVCPAIVAAGAIAAAIERLQDPNSPEALMASAASLLHTLAGGSLDRCSAITAAGGVPALARCLRSDYWPLVKPAVLALAMLERHGSGHAEPDTLPTALQRLLAAALGAGVREAANALAISLVTGSFVDADQDLATWQAERRRAAARLLAAQEAAAGAAALAAAAPAPPTAAAGPGPPHCQRRSCAAPGCTNTRGLRLCAGCAMVRYCSEACSRAHWREHRDDCRRLQAERAAAAGGSSSTVTSASAS